MKNDLILERIKSIDVDTVWRNKEEDEYFRRYLHITQISDARLKVIKEGSNRDFCADIRYFGSDVCDGMALRTDKALIEISDQNVEEHLLDVIDKLAHEVAVLRNPVYWNYEPDKEKILKNAGLDKRHIVKLTR